MNSFLTHFVLHRHGGAVAPVSRNGDDRCDDGEWLQLDGREQCIMDHRTSGSGTASATASYTVAVNKPKHVRTGTVTIAGRTVTITQLGNPPGKPINVNLREFSAVRLRCSVRL